VFVPGFSEYALALREAGAAVTEIPLPEAEDFRLTEKQVLQIPQDIQLLFLCNPNNPTGLLTERKTLSAILSLCRERGAILCADECFLDFCVNATEHSLIPALSEYPNLVILRAFTKTYAMAGLRLGYALCRNKALAERLQNSGPPWVVSGVAQEAGIEALCETNYVNRLRVLISDERRRMKAALEALGLRVIPGEANFLHFQSADTALAEKLRARGMLIRECADFAGLRAGWYRTAIRTAGENDILIKTIGEVLYG
jgi:threonine-phosphate decarboxylase